MIKSASVFGLGKLGLPLAVCLANKDYTVTGYDVNKNIIVMINRGQSPYSEPGLEKLLKSALGHFSATSDYAAAVNNSEITFIVVPTPSTPDGGFTTEYVEAAVTQIGGALKTKKSFHIVVVTSTVLPGATEGTIKPILEKTSGKKCGRDFGLCYSPEFIALGSVIRDFTNPDVVLIGESDAKSGALLEEIYQKVCDNNPPIVRTTLNNGELAKISLNAFVTMKISFANTLAEIAEKMPGGNADIISKVLGFDTRIGRKYLSGGLAYGGPCFPRDNRAFTLVARQFGCDAKLAAATDGVNQRQNERLANLIIEKIGGVKGKNIAILGLTYKSNTDVVEEAAPVKIALHLLQKNAGLKVYDPLGKENARKILGDDNIVYCNSVSKCLKDTEFCLIGTNWEEFKQLTPDDFIRTMKKARLLDCWHLYNPAEFSKKLDYTAIGIAPGK
jgi:UDPglucose 6-dehydrogenase